MNKYQYEFEEILSIAEKYHVRLFFPQFNHFTIHLDSKGESKINIYIDVFWDTLMQPIGWNFARSEAALLSDKNYLCKSASVSKAELFSSPY